ncbi:DMT family transporter [Petropleomorpha daqingensis]|uniref:Drug/metabolite transporter (DMT)-like permease n=1 Tax=Petropleomorpha daqingensis TaxID=2026353 RepID=A0A853CMC2_9ACTN|nr:drug/metabolite transporter (DMT)-like permease [Petropleomorpha daqingensis]
MILPTVVGLLAAFLFAASAVLQQRASRGAIAERHDHGGHSQLTRYLPVLLLVRRLLGHPLWLIGWLTNLFGFLAQALALHFGSVALVQPLLTTQLLFTLALVSLGSRRRPLTRDWLSVLSMCAGVAIFLSVRGAAPVEGAAQRSEVLLALTASAVVVFAIVVFAQGREPTVHAATIGVAAGICFAVSAVLIKLTTTDLLDRGVLATALDWPGYALAVSTAIGLLLGQQAYAAASLPVAVAAMSVTNPLVSYLIGVLAFHVHLPTDPGTLVAVAVSLLLLFLGAVGLAHSPAIRQDVAPEVLEVSRR